VENKRKYIPVDENWQEKEASRNSKFKIQNKNSNQNKIQKSLQCPGF
jgi:hypothetical protein